MSLSLHCVTDPGIPTLIQKVGDDPANWIVAETITIPNATRYQIIPKKVNDVQLNIEIVYRDEYLEQRDKEGKKMTTLTRRVR